MKKIEDIDRLITTLFGNGIKEDIPKRVMGKYDTLGMVECSYDIIYKCSGNLGAKEARDKILKCMKAMKDLEKVLRDNLFIEDKNG